jgi:hypothetical protein
MPTYTKRKSKLHVQLTNSDHASAHGGQVLVDALCRRFDLWRRIQQEPSLDPRTRQNVGFTPAAHIAQILFALTSGGASLADAERMGQDKVLLNLLGLAKGADQTTLGEWLRAQTKESVQVLHQINAQLVDWSISQAKPACWLHAGQAEVFFDDTQIEVLGHKFEGARLNHEGNRALGWQTLWLGPWLLDGILDGAGDVSQHLPELALTVGASATTNGPTSWIVWRPSCRRANGAPCPPPIKRQSNTPGSNISPASASKCRSLPPCVGKRRET